MIRVKQGGIIAPNMLADFISGAEFINEFEVEMSFKNRTWTQGKETLSHDMNF
jgi:hypothetical protein